MEGHGKKGIRLQNLKQQSVELNTHTMIYTSYRSKTLTHVQTHTLNTLYCTHTFELP